MNTIEESTPLSPIIIASNVETEVGELIHYLNPSNPPVQRLVARADQHFRTNKTFARKIRSNSGREWLYAFMRHWLAGMLVEAGCPRETLPPGFANGKDPDPF